MADSMMPFQQEDLGILNYYKDVMAPVAAAQNVLQVDSKHDFWTRNGLQEGNLTYFMPLVDLMLTALECLPSLFQLLKVSQKMKTR